MPGRRRQRSQQSIIINNNTPLSLAREQRLRALSGRERSLNVPEEANVLLFGRNRYFRGPDEILRTTTDWARSMPTDATCIDDLPHLNCRAAMLFGGGPSH